jgi:hypothetical protein
VLISDAASPAREAWAPLPGGEAWSTRREPNIDGYTQHGSDMHEFTRWRRKYTADGDAGTRVVDFSKLTISKYLGEGEFAMAHQTVLDERPAAIKMLKKETVSRDASVICTLHQPSSHLFQLFDRVICLSEGHIIYQGPVNGIKEYFETNFSYTFPKYTNPSDFLLKLAQAPHLVSPFFTFEILRAKAEETYNKMITVEDSKISKYTYDDMKCIKSIRYTHFWKQFWLLFLRVYVGFWR